MKIEDDTVRASHAARDLLRLYDAYRATARAQLAAIEQVQRRLGAAARGQRPGDAAQLARRAALARHTDAAYAERRDQVQRRLHELLGIARKP